MKREYVIRVVAGTLVLAGTLLGYFIAKEWLMLPAFVGLNLLQSSFTKFCPLEIILKKLDVE
jgi:hypothetical protein